MFTLTDPKDNTKYELTENEFRAIFVLVSDCLHNMGGDRPTDIHEDPLTWTASEVLFDSGKWSQAKARGTYGALERKNLIYIDAESSADRYEDMVNEFVFDMFEEIWDNINSYEILKDLN